MSIDFRNQLFGRFLHQTTLFGRKPNFSSWELRLKELRNFDSRLRDTNFLNRDQCAVVRGGSGKFHPRYDTYRAVNL